MIRSSFHHNFAGELKWDRGGQKQRPHSLPRSNPPAHIIKSSYFTANVVLPVTRLHVLIIGTTVKDNVAVQRNVASIGVVGGFIRPEREGAILNSSPDMQFEDGALFLLSNGTNGRLIFRGRRNRRTTQLISCEARSEKHAAHKRHGSERSHSTGHRRAVAARLAKEFANNVIVALTLWKFDSGLPTLGASEVLKAREIVGINHRGAIIRLYEAGLQRYYAMGRAGDCELRLAAREPRLRPVSVIFHLRVKRSYGQTLALGIPARRVVVNHSACPVRR